MMKFEPLDIADSLHSIQIEPIENGYIVKRYTAFSSATLYCNVPAALADLVDSALHVKARC